MTIQDPFLPATNAPPGLVFRLIRPGDREALYTACYTHHARPRFHAQFKRSLQRQEQGRGRHVLAVQDNHILGSGQLHRYAWGAEIADVVVARAHRNRGIGSTLITVLIDLAHALGWHPLEIGVKRSNGRALALYRRMGFVDDREIVLTTGETAIILCYERPPTTG